MSNPATVSYIRELTNLKPGDLGLLRSHSGLGIDEAVPAFDLFAGLWWPLRQNNQFAPRRHVAWLVAKLYAFRPLVVAQGAIIARQLRCREPSEESARKSFRQRFDALLQTPLDDLETPLQWALNEINNLNSPKLDWAQLTDDLSLWDRGAQSHKHDKRVHFRDIREVWAEEFLGIHQQSQFKEETAQC